MIRVRVEWKPADCWIGVFWRRSTWGLRKRLDVWICLLPMLPLHITIISRLRVVPDERWKRD